MLLSRRSVMRLRKPPTSNGGLFSGSVPCQSPEPLSPSRRRGVSAYAGEKTQPGPAWNGGGQERARRPGVVGPTGFMTTAVNNPRDEAGLTPSPARGGSPQRPLDRCRQGYKGVPARPQQYPELTGNSAGGVRRPRPDGVFAFEPARSGNRVLWGTRRAVADVKTWNLLTGPG